MSQILFPTTFFQWSYKKLMYLTEIDCVKANDVCVYTGFILLNIEYTGNMTGKMISYIEQFILRLRTKRTYQEYSTSIVIQFISFPQW